MIRAYLFDNLYKSYLLLVDDIISHVDETA